VRDRGNWFFANQMMFLPENTANHCSRQLL